MSLEDDAVERAVQASLDELLEEWHRMVGSLSTEVTHQRERAEQAELALTTWRAMAMARDDSEQKLGDAWQRGVEAGRRERPTPPAPPAPMPWDVRFYRTCYAVATISGGCFGAIVGAWFL